MRCGFLLLLLAPAACQPPAGSEPDPLDPEPHARITGKPLGDVIRQLGDPDEIAEGQYFGTKFSEGTISAVLKYKKLNVYVYLSDKGIVMGVAQGSTKNFIKG